MKSFFYIIAQIIFTIYCIFIGLSVGGFFYLTLIGLINIPVCFFVKKKNRRILIVSTLFYVLVFLFYTYLLFDILIIKGLIRYFPDPFFMMGAIVNMPVILYCVIIVIFLIKKIVLIK